MTVSKLLRALLALVAGVCVASPGCCDFTFVQISDIHVTPEKSEVGQNWARNREALIRQVNAQRPDFVIVTGDLTETGASADFRALKGWLRKFDAPVYVVPGNHDVGRRVSRSPARSAKPPYTRSLLNYERVFGRSFYSFAHENAYFIFMNSGLFSTDNPRYPYQRMREMEAAQWLDSELRYANNAAYPLVFVLQHYPLKETQGLGDTLNRAEVSALMFGHIHRFTSGVRGRVLTVSVSSSKGGAAPNALPCFALVKVSGDGAIYNYIAANGEVVRPPVSIPARAVGSNTLWDVRSALFPRLPAASLERILPEPREGHRL
ncbi:MAG: metallophosphoesterase [Armatimonadetes bacterium]|nr:metallophosphoesterase [Armatimonadota bacterium]